MGAVPLTLAVGDYDHVRDLTSGRVGVEGIDLTSLNLQTEEIHHRFSRYREWDVSEFSLGKYVALRANGDDSLVAIPVFPSRVCRHSSIYIRPGGPDDPAQLAGARIGIPEWAQTASVYSRGFLAHEYGVGLDTVEWVQAGVNEPGRSEKVDLALPPGVQVTPIDDRSLDEMLVAGELDAVLSARPPRSFAAGDGRIVRMLADYRAVEMSYLRRTSIFPIMHLIVLKVDAYRAHPWTAMNLLEAFDAAKNRCVARLCDITASRSPVPWLPSVLAEYSWAFGEYDWWPYGLEPNRTTLEAFLNFAYEQGVAARQLAADELFAPETLSRYRV